MLKNKTTQPALIKKTQIYNINIQNTIKDESYVKK